MFFALHELVTAKTILFLGSFTSCEYLSCATSTWGFMLLGLDQQTSAKSKANLQSGLDRFNKLFSLKKIFSFL
jgi:hypothetical protein